MRLARELIEAGELGEIRHFRARYLQDWAEDPSLDTWRFSLEDAGSGAIGDLATHAVDLSRFLVGEIAALSAVVKTFVPGRKVDDAIESVVEFEGGTIGTIEATRLALGRRNAFQWEINGSKGSLWFDMERMNELQVFRADGDRARGAKTVLVTEADHPFMRLLVAARAISSAGATPSRTRSCTCSRRSRTTATLRRTARPSRTATARARSVTRSCGRRPRAAASSSRTARSERHGCGQSRARRRVARRFGAGAPSRR